MTRISPPEQLVTNAVVEAVRAALSPLKVGDHVVPTGAGDSYAIVYQIPGGVRYGSLEQPEEDAGLVFQVSCVGKIRMQAQYLADRVRSLVLGDDMELTLTDWVINNKVAETPSGVQVEGKTKEDRLYTVPQLFTLYVTPA